MAFSIIPGTAGGLGLLIGPAGRPRLKTRRNPVLSDEKQEGMDIGFLVLFFLTSLTGLLLLLLRETPAMGALLAVPLGTVLGLFLTMPYGKFAHALYRSAALVRFAIEESRPLPKFGSD